MRELTFVEPGKLEWRDAPEPKRDSRLGALVRPVAVGLCDVDQLTIRGKTPLPGPYPIGHECVARVLDVGEQVATVRVGDLVVVPYHISCGTCGACRRARPASCTTVAPESMYGFGLIGGPWGGMFSDVLSVPYADAMLVPLPAGISPVAAAACGDNMTIGYCAVAPTLDATEDATVLVLGGGYPSSGLYAAACAVALGAARVDYRDEDADRLARAERMGAHPIEGPPPERCGPYPLTINANTTVEGLACAIRSTARDGVCECVAIYFDPVTPVPLLDMWRGGFTFKTGPTHTHPAIRPLFDLMAANKLDAELTVSATAEWNDAIDAILEGTSSKLVVTRRD